MAFNKIKAQENALKYLNQGKVAQAIAEYQQILRNDPKDQATLMTVGDLFARQGDMPQATEYFERLAQVYLNDGFNSKAIAIYKKIAKLAPNELAPLERLADLYVQQGVLSEARPLFLQIAEAYLKANKSQKAVEVLRRLLDVEPDNLRVQMRLAELYNVMGQKKEAAQTYLNYAQRLFEHGEHDEVQKLIERALEVDAGNAAALLLKARSLAASNKVPQAIKILESHPEAGAGGEVTALLLDLELKSGKTGTAAERGRKELARGHAHFAALFKVAETEIESGRPQEALPLLNDLRDAMIEAGEQDKFTTALQAACERMPGNAEPLEMLVDFCRTTSNSHELPLALSQLADTYAAAGNFTRAEECLQELIERNKDDERIVERLNQLRARTSGTAQPAAPAAPVAQAPAEPEAGADLEESAASPAIVEETLDEETQKYIAQALTDVDLFSSYGLTQKATHLLENVLQRAPRHTPTLERLLDLHLGAGNERRTAELAAILEQIHRERNDTANADRFTELRQRFSKAAGLTEEDMPKAPAAPAAPAEVAPPQAAEQPSTPAAAPVPEPKAAVEPPVVEAAPSAKKPAAAPEFEIPLMAVEPEPEQAEVPLAPAAAAPEKPHHEAAPVAAAEEVDLSDEWEAMVQEVSEPAPAPVAEEKPAAEPPAAAPPEPEPVAEQAEEVPEPVAAAPEPEAIEIIEEPAAEPSIELVEAAPEGAATPEAVEAGDGDFELELTQEPARADTKKGAATTEDFIHELVAEIEGMEEPAAEVPVKKEQLAPAHEPMPEPVAAQTSPPAGAPPAPEVTAESLNQLAEVFQEFRSELGEMNDEDEDLETHYNLGIAYREMGLLDEAIGEFQKVAKAIQKGKPFRYAMNCSTMLGLSFMDKGEPKIASLWYERALGTPGLEQEAVLALRYDLGVALEEAGESDAALDCFRQVYAMNIDYRDVGDRIATLQKQ
ncbi:MAG TPA: tetratricopeptide repeat protein [Candidatus Limnocylindrales bacterium]|nr:tetratricopeptide repeat protein [Candidatus Limnocylindrales bacterium]